MAIGCVRGLRYHPTRLRGACIRTYRVLRGRSSAGGSGQGGGKGKGFVASAPRLVFVHETPVGGPPVCMKAFQGRLLVGVGRGLLMLGMGRRRLLRKATFDGLPSLASCLEVMPRRKAGAGTAAGVAQMAGVDGDGTGEGGGPAVSGSTDTPSEVSLSAMLSAAAARTGTTAGSNGGSRSSRGRNVALAALSALIKPSVPTLLDDPAYTDALS